MLCPQCQTENPANAKFCLNCGDKLALACPQCGAQLPPQAKFCMECGAKIGAAPPPAISAPPVPPPAPSPISEKAVPDTPPIPAPELAEPERDISFLQTFLSRGRCQALATGQALPKTASGACLFADISGFTPLAEALRKSLQPRQGAEALNSIINSVFETLISQVHRFGGDVLGFAGDAFTCWFDGETSFAHMHNGGEFQTLVQTLACAQAIQSEMKRFGAMPTPDGATQSLRVKVGVAAGDTRRLLLGAPEYGLFDLMVGAPLSRMAAAEHHAKVGEIIGAPEVVMQIGAQAEWSEAGDGYGRLISLDQRLIDNLQPAGLPRFASLSQQVLRPYFPPDILRWLVYGTAGIIAELRPVISAFIRFEGLDYIGDPDVEEKLDQYVRRIQQIANHYGGNLRELDYGDKGSVAHVIFGAPVAHEDDDARAVGWAVDLQAAVKELPFIAAQYIGITKGQVYAGAVGALERRVYAMMGDEVNGSARLMQACQPGQILVSQRIMQATQKLFMFHQYPGFQVKGKFEPVPVATPLGRLPPLPQLLPASPLVGREAELARLLQMLDELCAGQGQSLRIEGGAGIGKSRLAAELFQRANARGVRTLIGNGQSYGRSAPYLPWREIIQGLFNLQPTWPAAQQAMQMQGMLQWIAPEAASQLPLLGDLLGLQFPDTPVTAGLDGQQRQSALFSLTHDLFGRLATQQPLLLLLEDCQWMDEASQALVEFLAARLPAQRLMLVFTHYPASELAHAVLPALSAFPHHHDLSLGELTGEQVGRLLKDRLGGEAPQSLLEMIQEKTQGNPLFVEELAEMMRETSRLKTVEGHWVLIASESAALQIPDTVQDVTLARLDRLDESCKLTLKVASAAGRSFDLSMLAHIHPAQPTAGVLENQLQELEKRQFISTELPPPDPLFRFKQNLIREVAYQTLPFSLRRQLHRQVALRIEQLYASDLTSHYALLAHHWAQAEQTEQAIHYLLLAGDTARRLYALKEAIEHYQAALRLLEKDAAAGRFDLRARTWMKLGLTFQLDSDYRNARQAYETGFDLWRQAAEAPVEPLAPATQPLRMDWPYMPLSLDPAYAADVDTYGLSNLLFSGLVSLGSSLEALPDCAASWEVLDDGLRYIFHLRDDIRWSDGVAVSAQDFEFAWKRVLAPESDSPLAGLLYPIKGALPFHSGQVTDPTSLGVRALDEHTLEATLEQPTSYFLYLAANQAYLPIPRHVVALAGQGWAEPERLVSNGAFRLSAWQQENEQQGDILLARNPGYHGRFLGNLSQVKLCAHPSPQARLQAYESDQLDLLSLRDFKEEREQIRQKHPGEYLSAPNLGLQYLGFAVQKAPFDDARVRRAFVMAVDRERYADEFLHGFAFPGTGGFVPPGMPGHSPAIGLPYDPEQARQALAEAGYPAGAGFPPVEFIAGPGLEQDLEYLVAGWQTELKISVRGTVLDWDGYLERLQKDLPGLYMSIWVNDYPDPDNFLRANDAVSWAGWREPRYLELVEAARQALDQQKRLELYREADRILIQAAVLMPFKYLRSHFLLKPWLKRFPVSAIAWWYLSEARLESDAENSDK